MFFAIIGADEATALGLKTFCHNPSVAGLVYIRHLSAERGRSRQSVLPRGAR